MTFQAKTNSNGPGGWNAKGKGTVMLHKVDEDVLTFNEKGAWNGSQGTEVVFSNIFRWTLDRSAQIISLEHLRYGPDRPVFLFHLSPTGEHTLSSVDPHLCGGDTYFGQIHFDQHVLHLNWRVIGSRKNEELDYCYY